MATATAVKLCPDLLLIPPNMEKYRTASRQIMEIYRDYTELVEPLSLDEAYLDVTNSPHCKGSATLIARDEARRIQHGSNNACCHDDETSASYEAPRDGWRRQS